MQDAGETADDEKVDLVVDEDPKDRLRSKVGYCVSRRAVTLVGHGFGLTAGGPAVAENDIGLLRGSVHPLGRGSGEVPSKHRSVVTVIRLAG